MPHRSQRHKQSLFGGQMVVISALSPNTGTVNSSVTLNVMGGSFYAGDSIVWNGAPVATTLVNMGQLRTTSPITLPAAAGSIPVLVRRGSGDSNSLIFSVT